LFALDGDEWAPRLSPDGQRVLFQSDPEGDVDLFTIRLDGTDLRKLTHRPGFDGVASWSPDGRRVAFYSRTLPSDTTSAALRASWLTAELFVVDADGSGPPRALTDNRHRDQSPTWSPDGTRIAFTSCGSGSLEVWTTDASGTADQQMTQTPAEALRAGRGSPPDDSLEVASVVERYVRGWREGNVALLREVLAPQGVIMWTGDEGVRTITFEQIFVNRRPNPGYGEPWRLVDLRIVDGRMAIVEVDISLPTEDIEYTDMLTLYEVDGRWMIVNKAYSLRRGG
jgi:Tol biopolymer transport system component